MRFAVTHSTAYTYEQPVSLSYGEAHLLPRDAPGQRVLSATLEVLPQPGTVRERTDYFGNRASYFEVTTRHTRLEVVATSQVEIDRRDLGGQLLADQPWETVRDRLRGQRGQADPALLEASEYCVDSPQAPRSRAAAGYAVPSFRPGRPVLEAVEDLSSRIHREFAFKPGATTVGTAVDTVIARRAGVCQDFAHLTVSALRSLGLAARYVSGYLETEPPPGKPKLQGADVSHAWPSVFVPDIGWVDIDPTNDQFVGDRYITTAWGRDYGDVAPLQGVIFTDGDTQRLEVSVDVRRVDATQPIQYSQQQSQTQSQSQSPPPSPIRARTGFDL